MDLPLKRVLLALLLSAPAASAQNLAVEVVKTAPTGAPVEVGVTGTGLAEGASVTLTWAVGGGEARSLTSAVGPDGTAKIPLLPDLPGEARIEVRAGDRTAAATTRFFPGWLSLMPPLVAIGLAILTRQVVVALFAGILVGALVRFSWRPVTAVLSIVDTYALDALKDESHASIVIFSLLLGGMVAVVTRAGGMAGIVEAFRAKARSRRGAQSVGFFLGLVIFFDDYANSLVIGNTMRPLTDRMRISREKLAYIVDSTAAPVAGLALVSTWVGYEVGLIKDSLAAVGIGVDAYKVFLSSIPYSFYPLFALAMVALVAVTGREFGPMLAAERRAALGGKVLRDGATPLAATESEMLTAKAGAPPRWWNALIPIGVLTGTVLVGLWWTGRESLAADGDPLGTRPALEVLGSGNPVHALGDIFSSANSYGALLWGSLAGCIAAVVLAVSQRVLRLDEAMAAWLAGITSMMLAMVVLILAWSIGAVCRDLRTAEWLVAHVSDGLPPFLLPTIVFLLGALIAFATGTSWGTMAILVPLAVPLAHHAGAGAAASAGEPHWLLVATVAAVLAGAIFVDHCSPISDTTVLSSMASGSDHIDHVRTQLPYAATAAAVAIVCGTVPAGLGVSPLLSLGAGLVAMVLAVRFIGRRIEPESPML